MTNADPIQTDAALRPRGRLYALDVARSAALLAMAIYHFVYDLELFGHLAPFTASTGGWRILALATAGSFLALAGMSLWLAHGAGIQWRGFLWRFGKIAAAAALITGATLVAVPDAFIFFGILHAIALSSLIGLACLRLPDWAVIALAVALFWLATQPGLAAFDAPVLWWTGLQAVPIRSVDYVPLVPWFAPFLLGLATAKLGDRIGLWDRLARAPAPRWLVRAGVPGRHSLIIYLVHQPVLIALIWGVSLMLG